MKVFGWFYISVYCISALLSLVTSFIRDLEPLNNTVSAPVGLLSLVVFILAYVGTFASRKIFLYLSGLYMLMVGFGLVLIVLLFSKLGASLRSQEITLEFFQEQFVWFAPVHWAFTIAWLLMSVYGIVAYSKA